MAAQGAFGTDFYDRSTRTIVGTMLCTEYRPVVKIGSKGALGIAMRSAQSTPLRASDRVSNERVLGLNMDIKVRGTLVM